MAMSIVSGIQRATSLPLTRGGLIGVHSGRCCGQRHGSARCQPTRPACIGSEASRKTPISSCRSASQSLVCRAGTSLSDGMHSDQTLTKESQLKRSSGQNDNQTGNALFGVIILNIAVFVLDHVLKQGWVRLLYLNHSAPQIWQFVSCAFCHGSWNHLCSNLFGLYVFGREVETDGGALGFTTTYLFTAAGASIASYFLLPRNSLSLGASGAVFGLYCVSILLKLSSGFSIRKVIEAGILGQFVVGSLQQEFVKQSSIMGQGAMVGASGISHVAHLAGAAAGVLLIFLLSRLPRV